jgi:putative ABC transport system permease protein
MSSQVVAITSINFKSIPERWTLALVVVVGLAGVVAVFTALLAMYSGFAATLAANGRSDVAIVLRGGSESELNSAFDRDSIDLIKLEPGIRHASEGQTLASAEMSVIAELIRKGDVKSGANITVRGVEPTAFALHSQVKIVAGRPFNPGLRELIVGRGVTRQFQGAEIGQTVRMRGSDWNVVGIFESGDSHESELWTDLDVARSTFGRTGANAVFAPIDGSDGLGKLKAALASDPRLSADVQTEQEYLSGQTKQFRQTIGGLAFFITLIMALGAIFAALNTMYAAVAARGKEIATLRAIGFGGGAVLVSVMVESMVLALIGGALGALIAYVLFNGISVSTLGQNFTQVVFAFKVTPQLVLAGLVIALIVGFLGGLLPAIRAARMPVTTALREL